MIFVDSNIPMYLVGSEHPNKTRAQRALEKALLEGERLVTDAEVLQEILHRYVAIDRRDAIQAACDALVGTVDEVYAVELRDTVRAKDLLLGRFQLSARDAIHVAVMERESLTRILTFDTGFDSVPGIERISV